MQDCLEKSGIFSFQPIAVSLGGDQDLGRDMPDEGRALLIEDMKESGFPVIREDELKANVDSRMDLYFQRASGKKIKAFVNIGGSWSNMGTDSQILHIQPGLGKITRFPSEENRGVLFAMAALDIPVIHLLYVKGLVQRSGLPWDPVPLPQPGKGALYPRILEERRSFLIISVAYLLLVAAAVVFGLKKST